MESAVKQRLEFFLKTQKISKSEFGRRVGASASYVASIRKSIAPDKIEGIAENWPDLNIAWLMTGEGNMLKSQTGHTVVTGDISINGNNVVAANAGIVNQGKRESLDAEKAEDIEIKETIILTPEILNQEGIDLHKEITDGTLDAEVKLTQDVLPSHHAKVYTENDEMSPEIEANDPIFVRFLGNKQGFINGRMYFVDLENGSVVRWVVRENNDHLRLISMRSEEVIPIASVKSISEVVAITKRPKTLPKHRVTMADVITHKDAQLDVLNSQIDKILEQKGRLIGIIEDQIKNK